MALFYNSRVFTNITIYFSPTKPRPIQGKASLTSPQPKPSDHRKYFLAQLPSKDFQLAPKLTSQREIPPFFQSSYSKAERIKHRTLKADLQLRLWQGETSLRIKNVLIVRPVLQSRPMDQILSDRKNLQSANGRCVVAGDKD